ncbi:MAG TPA: SHOCT domain-containing protein [Thermoplasmata archaeon]|nr:SHOCT domain-containing protein [Thermoplasmata archaeon]
MGGREAMCGMCGCMDGHSGHGDENARDTLARRYAKGEISREEYLRMLEDLGEGRSHH